eukprot:1073036-Pyramimonas_sp.AAC.1
MPVDPLTKDDITKSNAALSELMTHGRLILVDECSELGGGGGAGGGGSSSSSSGSGNGSGSGSGS